jgi:putative nucleotidyltransferase with HDIG domain
MSEGRILVVDDEASIREVMFTLLESQGYECITASDGNEALRAISHRAPDLVISDIVMPGLDGIKLLGALQLRDAEMPVIMVTALHDLSTALQAMRAGAYDFVLKPFERDQLFFSVNRALKHRRLVLQNRAYQQDLERLVAERTKQLSHALRDLEQSYDYTLEALGGALDAKDAEIEGHCQRVTALTLAIARLLPVEPSQLKQIAFGAFLHDIGKMGIPDHILRKPGPLNDEERAIMRRHCTIGYAVLERIPFLHEASEIVLSHQEHFHGSGYPRGLCGEAIPMGARIFAVADTLDAMISDRPYRKALPIEAARNEIETHAGTQFDPRVVRTFLAQHNDFWIEIHRTATVSFSLSELMDAQPRASAGA